MDTFPRLLNLRLVIFIAVLQIELLLIRQVSDLTPGTSNWIEKSEQILGLRIPEDNFYGPGAALMMAPFVFFGVSSYLANMFYLALGSIAYWNICSLISSRAGKAIALTALPLNIYLIWLIDSSQDTVFEFFLLTCSVLFLVKKRILLFALSGFLLCETRAGYWVFYLGISGYLFIREYSKNRKIVAGKLFAFYFLIVSSLFNFVNYGSPSPALEGGVTTYFSYTKYHYLALPKMDMDVFLSGPQGAFSSDKGPHIPTGSTPAEINSIFQKAALESALANKPETLLGWMQKFDSYFFDVQKIPHLPGQYVIDLDRKVIEIGDERLSWSLIIGNLIYMFYRTALLISGLLAVGLFLGMSHLNKRSELHQFNLLPLVTPFIFGALPGILIYTETRFKIVSELLLIPCIVEIWTKFNQKRLN